MSPLLIVYCISATLLLIHEIESAYEKEWEILALPGGISGFLLLHIPIILIVFYGAIELAWGTLLGSIISLILGFGGLLPFFVHGVLVRRKVHFNRITSWLTIYANMVVGIALLIISLSKIVA